MLRPLPSDHKDMDMYEVWCGSEFTIAADKSGRLYSQGWNEHGNLGCGKQPNIEGSTKNSWCKVIDEEGNPINLSTVYEGNVACGGAHVISLPSF